MITTICDLCKEQIEGDYKQVSHATTNLLPNEIFIGHVDVCMKCWKAFTETRRIPLVEFPNTEAKDHE